MSHGPDLPRTNKAEQTIFQKTPGQTMASSKAEPMGSIMLYFRTNLLVTLIASGFLMGCKHSPKPMHSNTTYYALLELTAWERDYLVGVLSGKVLPSSQGPHDSLRCRLRHSGLDLFYDSKSDRLVIKNEANGMFEERLIQEFHEYDYQSIENSRLFGNEEHNNGRLKN